MVTQDDALALCPEQLNLLVAGWVLLGGDYGLADTIQHFLQFLVVDLKGNLEPSRGITPADLPAGAWTCAALVLLAKLPGRLPVNIQNQQVVAIWACSYTDRSDNTVHPHDLLRGEGEVLPVFQRLSRNYVNRGLPLFTCTNWQTQEVFKLREPLTSIHPRPLA